MSRIFDVLFGCPHHRYTFPMSRKPSMSRNSATPPTTNGTYVVCLDCGREFPYDWRQMKILPDCEPAAVLTEAQHAVDRAA